MKAKTLAELPRLAIVAIQLAFTFALWLRIEWLAEAVKSAQVNAEIAAQWAQALAEDSRKR